MIPTYIDEMHGYKLDFLSKGSPDQASTGCTEITHVEIVGSQEH